MERKKRRFCELNGCIYLKNNQVTSHISNQLLICKCCKGTYCSEECVIEHMIQKEREKTMQDNSLSSIFIKPGKIVSESNNIPHKYFNFENFEKVKLQNKKAKVLGNGAFGEVFLVKNKIDGKLFAMKQMDKSRIHSVGIKSEVIYREINIHMSLIHDHIARLFSYHEDNKAFYLIIEYVENGTLFSVIQKNKGLTEDDAFKYFIQVASALFFLHSNNLIHRDLKPENCLIDKDGNVKLCDFGWTVDTLHGERATFCGTYEYMAPEIIKEKPYSKSIDVWSLGVLLYELIHSYSPFRLKKNQIANSEQADPSLEVLKNILKHHYTIDKNVSDDCKDVLRDLLNPKNEDRIEVAKIFAHPWVKKYENRIKSSIQFDDKTSTMTLRKENENNDTSNKFYTVKNLLSSQHHLKNNSIDSNATILKDVTIQNFNLNNKDYLLDDILEQLEMKNKKKGPSNSIKYNFCIDNINRTIEEEIKNVTKSNENHNKVSLRNLPSPIKTNKDGDLSMFSMFKEMNEIDKEISEKSRKYEKLEKCKNKMKTKIQNSSQIYGDYNKDKFQSIIADKQKGLNCIESEKTQPQSIINSECYSIHTSKKTNRGKEERTSRESDCPYGNTATLNDDLMIKSKKSSKIDSGHQLRESFRKVARKSKTKGKTKNLRDINKELEELEEEAQKNRLKLSHELMDMSVTMETPFNTRNKKSEMSVQTDNDSSMWSKFWDLFNIKCG